MFPVTTKILVTDDSKSMRLIIVHALKSMGFLHVFEAENGALGFQRLEADAGSSEPFGLVLSDQNMPDCTGLEFLRKVRALPQFSTLPFIMITSETDKAMIMDLVQAGASNYLSKPFDAEKLKAKLKDTYSRLNK